MSENTATAATEGAQPDTAVRATDGTNRGYVPNANIVKGPDGLTDKQRAFVQVYVTGSGSASDAYRKAFDASRMTKANINQKAHKLLRKPEVERAINKHRAKMAEQFEYDLRAAMADAREAYTFAKQTNNAGAMVSAATLMAKLNGRLVERREVRSGPLDQIPTDDLAILRAALEQSTRQDEPDRTTH